jgi:hypothetical protein
MSSGDNSAAWFELRTQRGNSIIVKDDELPLGSKGRIYLFNTERDAMVEYDPAIVVPKLFELDEAQLSEAKSKYSKAFKEARKQLLKKLSKYSQTTSDENPDTSDGTNAALDEEVEANMDTEVMEDDDDLFDDED